MHSDWLNAELRFFTFTFSPFHFFTFSPFHFFTFSPLIQFHYGYPCSAELYVLVAEGCYGGHGGEVLADELAQYARAGAVEYAHAGHAYEQGVVDEVGYGRKGFVAAHAAHVDVLLEGELAAVYRLARLPAYGGVWLGFFALWGVGALEALGAHLGAHAAEYYGGRLAVGGFYAAYGRKAFYAHGVAGGERWGWLLVFRF